MVRAFDDKEKVMTTLLRITLKVITLQFQILIYSHCCCTINTSNSLSTYWHYRIKFNFD